MPPRSLCVPLGALLTLSACTMTPPGLDQERDAMERTGVRYEPSPESRILPDLPASPGWKDVLSRAFLSNGELEAAYFEWKAALARVGIAGAWPNTDLMVGFSYAFSADRMNSFDRQTFTAAPDSTANLTIPAKARQAAKVALDEARASGERFRRAKFDVQKRVLFAWADYVELGREIALKEQDLALRGVEASALEGRIGEGGDRRGAIAARLALQSGRSELDDLRARQDARRAMLNAMIGRDPHDPLAAPLGPAQPRPVPADDAALLRAGADMFPEVSELAREADGRRDALELARMRWIPDINPTFSFTGSATQAIGAMVALPTTVAQIRGRIEEAQAQIRAADARLRQRRAERIGEYVALIVELRRAEARTAYFRSVVLPAGRRMAEASSFEYESGAGALGQVLDARRAILDAELTVARSEADMERAIVDIECCLGVDIETVHAGPERGSTGELPHD